MYKEYSQNICLEDYIFYADKNLYIFKEISCLEEKYSGKWESFISFYCTRHYRSRSTVTFFSNYWINWNSSPSLTVTLRSIAAYALKVAVNVKSPVIFCRGLNEIFQLISFQFQSLRLSVNRTQKHNRSFSSTLNFLISNFGNLSLLFCTWRSAM